MGSCIRLCSVSQGCRTSERDCRKDAGQRCRFLLIASFPPYCAGLSTPGVLSTVGGASLAAPQIACTDSFHHARP